MHWIGRRQISGHSFGISVSAIIGLAVRVHASVGCGMPNQAAPPIPSVPATSKLPSNQASGANTQTLDPYWSQRVNARAWYLRRMPDGQVVDCTRLFLVFKSLTAPMPPELQRVWAKVDRQPSDPLVFDPMASASIANDDAAKHMMKPKLQDSITIPGDRLVPFLIQPVQKGEAFLVSWRLLVPELFHRRQYSTSMDRKYPLFRTLDLPIWHCDASNRIRDQAKIVEVIDAVSALVDLRMQPIDCAPDGDRATATWQGTLRIPTKYADGLVKPKYRFERVHLQFDKDYAQMEADQCLAGVWLLLPQEKFELEDFVGNKISLPSFKAVKFEDLSTVSGTELADEVRLEKWKYFEWEYEPKKEQWIRREIRLQFKKTQ